MHETSKKIFIPLTVGGGIRTLRDIKQTLRAGADKVAINTAAIKNPDFITQAARTFGSQCVVISVDAKKISGGKWEAYTDNAREQTGLDVVGWIKKAQKLGAGEILLTSVNNEGMQQGFDFELIKQVAKIASIPFIVSGGAGKIEDFIKCAQIKNVNGLAAASILHYAKTNIFEIKNSLRAKKIQIRKTQPEGRRAAKINSLNKKESDVDNYLEFIASRYLKNRKSDVKNEKTEKVKLENKIKKDAKISLIDYGLNNVQSIVRSFEKIGKSVQIVNKPKQILDAKFLVLPGMGAFKDGMEKLKKFKLINPIKIKAEQGTPIFGICLGLQLLFDESQEFGKYKGLGLISGKVIKIKSKNNKPVKIPHIGWNGLNIPKQTEKNNLIFKGIKTDSQVYFAHSYYPVPLDKKTIIARTKYSGLEFCVAVKKNNICATLFHPEKSGEIGLNILRNLCKEFKI